MTKKKHDTMTETDPRYTLEIAILDALIDCQIGSQCSVDASQPTADGRDCVALHAFRETARTTASEKAAKRDALVAEHDAAVTALHIAEEQFTSTEAADDWTAVEAARTAAARLEFLATKATDAAKAADAALATAHHALAAALRMRVLETLIAPIDASRELADALEHARRIAAAHDEMTAGIAALEAADAAAVARWEDACRAADAIGARRPDRPEIGAIGRHVARAVAHGGDLRLAETQAPPDRITGETYEIQPTPPSTVAFLTAERDSPRATRIAVVRGTGPAAMQVGAYQVRPDGGDDETERALRRAHASKVEHARRAGAEHHAIRAEHAAKHAAKLAADARQAAKDDQAARASEIAKRNSAELDRQRQAAEERRRAMQGPTVDDLARRLDGLAKRVEAQPS